METKRSFSNTKITFKEEERQQEGRGVFSDKASKIKDSHVAVEGHMMLVFKPGPYVYIVYLDV